ncbi:MAG: alpha/beta hydrolase [Spirochaetes bacterium]|nr:alpha/beta hydrolase [Spirochaetota bacterium]
MRETKQHRKTAPGIIALAAAMLLLLSCASKRPEGIYQVYTSKEGYDAMTSLYGTYLSKWPMPYREIDVETSWGTTHVIRTGLNRGKPVVVLHGAGSNAALTCMPGIERDHAVYTIDIMGEPGKSVPRRIPGTPADVAGWLNEVLIGLALDRAVIIGMSYGGFTGQWFLHYYPDKVQGLVMILYSYMDQSIPLGTFVKMTYYSIRNDDASVRAMMEVLNGGPVTDREAADLFAVHFRAVNEYCRQGRANPYTSVPAEGAQKVRVPVLIIMGERDPLFDAKKAAAFCREIDNPHIRYEMIKGMGHLPFNHLEQVSGLVKSFLERKV